MSAEPKRVWVLLGHRRGDNYQLLALARALGLPFETKQMQYNLLRKLPKQLLGHQLVSVLPEARTQLQPPWPDLVLAIGHRSVPVARYIRHRSGGRTKLVHLGNPRIHPSNFDLVITMPQYSIPPSERLLRLPLAMGSPHPVSDMTAQEQAWVDDRPRPHRLMVLGGPTKLWLMTPEDMAAAARRLVERSHDDGGTVTAVGSPRTEASVLDAVEAALGDGRHGLIRGAMPRYHLLLDDADEIYVTADSVSMLSEAVFTGKPVGMIPIRPSPRGADHYRQSDSGRRKPPFRNLRNVWKTLLDEGLVGTIDHPVAGAADDPVAVAVRAVREIM